MLVNHNKPNPNPWEKPLLGGLCGSGGSIRVYDPTKHKPEYDKARGDFYSEGDRIEGWMKNLLICIVFITMSSLAYGENNKGNEVGNSHLVTYLEGVWISIPPPSNGIKIEVKKSGALYKSLLIIRQKQETLVLVPRLKVVDKSFRLEIAHLKLNEKQKKTCETIYTLAKSLRLIPKENNLFGGERYTLRLGSESLIPKSPFAKDTKNYITWAVHSSNEESRAKISALVDTLPVRYLGH